MEIGEILPEELNERLKRGERPVILDVRELEEIAIASFPGATHIPMGEIPSIPTRRPSWYAITGSAARRSRCTWRGSVSSACRI
jgi:rhodanese-related sulfurtransferase